MNHRRYYLFAMLAVLLYALAGLEPSRIVISGDDALPILGEVIRPVSAAVTAASSNTWTTVSSSSSTPIACIASSITGPQTIAYVTTAASR